MSLLSYSVAQNEENLPSHLSALLQLAISCGFVYQQEDSGYWRISSQDLKETWSLQQTQENRWLLVIKGQPQISLTLSEVFTFLRRQNLKPPKVRKS